jgi:hypothetical protein
VVGLWRQSDRHKGRSPAISSADLAMVTWSTRDNPLVWKQLGGEKDASWARLNGLMVCVFNLLTRFFLLRTILIEIEIEIHFQL